MIMEVHIEKYFNSSVMNCKAPIPPLYPLHPLEMGYMIINRLQTTTTRIFGHRQEGGK